MDDQDQRPAQPQQPAAVPPPNQQPPVPPFPPPPDNQPANVQYRYGSQTHQHVQAKKRGNGLAVAGLVLGILACVFAFIPTFGSPMAGLLVFIGIPLAAVGLAKSAKAGGKGLAIAGLILLICAIAITVVWGFIVTRGLLDSDEKASQQNSTQSQRERGTSHVEGALLDKLRGGYQDITVWGWG